MSGQGAAVHRTKPDTDVKHHANAAAAECKMTWYFYQPIAHVHFKSTAEAAAGQVQGHAAAPTQDFNFWGVALKMHVADLRSSVKLGAESAQNQ